MADELSRKQPHMQKTGGPLRMAAVAAFILGALNVIAYPLTRMQAERQRGAALVMAGDGDSALAIRHSAEATAEEHAAPLRFWRGAYLLLAGGFMWGLDRHLRHLRKDISKRQKDAGEES